ncbi:hypothetical protein PSAC2689_30557 [Paraburkholderia sacchari]
MVACRCVRARTVRGVLLRQTGLEAAELRLRQLAVTVRHPGVVDSRIDGRRIAAIVGLLSAAHLLQLGEWRRTSAQEPRSAGASGTPDGQHRRTDHRKSTHRYPLVFIRLALLISAGFDGVRSRWLLSHRAARATP